MKEFIGPFHIDPNDIPFHLLRPRVLVPSSAILGPDIPLDLQAALATVIGPDGIGRVCGGLEVVAAVLRVAYARADAPPNLPPQSEHLRLSSIAQSVQVETLGEWQVGQYFAFVGPPTSIRPSMMSAVVQSVCLPLTSTITAHSP